MGCSSGPNAFLLIRHIMEIIHNTYGHLNRKPPILQVFLNDLPGNDFNTIFKSVPNFYEQLAKEMGSNFGPCFIAGMPGSFYERLFPNQTLHFVYSSNSLHWLSQVPKGLVSESGIPLNKKNIYITSESPPSLKKAYLDQFEADFMTFLRSRSEEMIPRSRMVLTFMGADQYSYSSKENFRHMLKLFGNILSDMVLEGLIEESSLESFNIPLYGPSPEEAKHVIQNEGSFTIHHLESLKFYWDAADSRNGKDIFFDDKYFKASCITKQARAIVEPLLSGHFGDSLMDTLFNRFTEKLAGYSEVGKVELNNLVIFLSKRA